MEFSEFFRMFWLQLVVAVLTPVILWLLYIALKNIFKEFKDSNTVKGWYIKCSKVIVIVVWLFLFINIIFIASTNLIPRSDLDRSNIEQKNKQWEQQHLIPTKTTESSIFGGR